MRRGQLKLFLDTQYEKFHHPDYLRLDPLRCLDVFYSPNDIEIAGLVASVLSYGRAEIIIRNVTRVFELTGRSIATFATETSFARKTRLFEGFRHRFTDGYDLALLLHCIGATIKEYGSLEALFAQGLTDEPTIKNSLDRFVRHLRRQAACLTQGRLKGVEYLLPAPSSGSACKRLNMFLRWMVRKSDGIDLGVWKAVPAARLVMPVDTHVARIGRALGLTERATVNWRMAEEITSRLRRFDPHDPVRYDFSLCRAGMVDFRKRAA